MCLYEALLLRFVEDMDQDEISKAMEMPAGLQNLGNTCYMNATIQVILSFPIICVHHFTRFQASLMGYGCNFIIIAVPKNCSWASPGSHQVPRYLARIVYFWLAKINADFRLCVSWWWHWRWVLDSLPERPLCHHGQRLHYSTHHHASGDENNLENCQHFEYSENFETKFHFSHAQISNTPK